MALIFLGLANLEVAYAQFQLLLFTTKEIYNYTFLINADFPIFYLFGPTIYLFVRQMIGDNFKINYKLLIHFLIAIPGIVYFIYFKTYSNEQVLQYLNSPDIPIFEVILNLIGFSSFAFYFIISLFKIIKYLKDDTLCQSETERKRAIWLRNTIILFIIITITFSPLVIVLHNDIYTQLLGLSSINIVFIYLFISFYGRPELLQGLEKSDNKTVKYLGSTLSSTKVEELTAKINAIMEVKKPFLNQDMSLSEMADMLDISSHQLSQVINQKFKMSFSDFINKYRIDEALKILNDKNSAKYTLESIANDCGFGNRVSFNSAFKKFTGKSPSDYRKYLQTGND